MGVLSARIHRSRYDAYSFLPSQVSILIHIVGSFRAFD